MDNAFNGIDVGSNLSGIERATVSDMHTIEEGVIPRIMEVVFLPLTDTQKSDIDTYVETLFCNGKNRSSERNRYP